MDHDRIAALRVMAEQARLTRDATEAETLAREVARLLDNFDSLAAVAVDAAAAETPRRESPLRPDMAEPSLPVLRALANCPRSREGYVSVPKVVTGDVGDTE